MASTTTTKTTAFNANGFAAVDAFFDQSASSLSSKTNSGTRLNANAKTAIVAKKIKSIDGHGHHHHPRSGVGASATPTTATPHAKLVQHQQHERILRIGGSGTRSTKTKHKKAGFGNADGVDENGSESENDDTDDNDDEIGRTSLYKKLVPDAITTKPDPPPNGLTLDDLTTNTKAKTKKQKSKQEKQESQTILKLDTVVTPAATESLVLEHQYSATQPRGDEAEDNQDIIMVDHNPTAAKKKKRRIKVRSRQKNIRKDHRDVKPETVQFRPLTEETKLRLRSPVIINTNSSMALQESEKSTRQKQTSNNISISSSDNKMDHDPNTKDASLNDCKDKMNYTEADNKEAANLSLPCSRKEDNALHSSSNNNYNAEQQRDNKKRKKYKNLQ